MKTSFNNVQIITFSGLQCVPLSRLEDCCSKLPEPERLRATTLKSERRWRQFVLGRVLLQAGLDQLLGLPLQLTVQENGKPAALGAEISVSHSGDLVAVAVSAGHDNPLGVDVELYKNRNFMRLARHYFAAEEVAELESLKGDEQSSCFFRFWVLKESLAKYLGSGLSSTLLRRAFTAGSRDDSPCSIYCAGENYALALTAKKLGIVESYSAELHESGVSIQPQQRHFDVWRPPLNIDA